MNSGKCPSYEGVDGAQAFHPPGKSSASLEYWEGETGVGVDAPQNQNQGAS